MKKGNFDIHGLVQSIVPSKKSGGQELDHLLYGVQNPHDIPLYLLVHKDPYTFILAYYNPHISGDWFSSSIYIYKTSSHGFEHCSFLVELTTEVTILKQHELTQ